MKEFELGNVRVVNLRMSEAVHMVDDETPGLLVVLHGLEREGFDVRGVNVLNLAPEQQFCVTAIKRDLPPSALAKQNGAHVKSESSGLPEPDVVAAPTNETEQ